MMKLFSITWNLVWKISYEFRVEVFRFPVGYVELVRRRNEPAETRFSMVFSIRCVFKK